MEVPVVAKTEIATASHFDLNCGILKRLHQTENGEMARLSLKEQMREWEELQRNSSKTAHQIVNERNQLRFSDVVCF
jgi:hypothetical protein